MASRRKLEVEEASGQEEKGSRIRFEEACILVTTVALLLGIIMILIKMGSSYDAGLFGG